MPDLTRALVCPSGYPASSFSNGFCRLLTLAVAPYSSSFRRKDSTLAIITNMPRIVIPDLKL